MHLRRIVVLLAAVTVLPWVAGPAAAEELRLVDARGDMWTAADDGSAVPAPTSTVGDVTSAKVIYQGVKVVVRLKFADLAKRGSYAQYTVVLQGSRDLRTREIVLEAGPRHWGGHARVFKRHGDLVQNCPVRHVIDYATETLRVRIDRDCLGRPGSVRANVNVYRADEAGDFYSDNPHDGAASSDDWTAWVRRTR